MRYSALHTAGHHLVQRAIQRYGEGRGWTWHDVWGQYFLDYDAEEARAKAEAEALGNAADWREYFHEPPRPLPFELTQAVAEEEARRQKAGVYLTTTVFDRRDPAVWGDYVGS